MAKKRADSKAEERKLFALWYRKGKVDGRREMQDELLELLGLKDAIGEAVEKTRNPWEYATDPATPGDAR